MVTFRFAVLFAFLMPIASAKSEEISLEELLQVWKQTTIEKLNCRIEAKISFGDDLTSPFGGNSEKPKDRTDKGVFFRDSELGMKLECGDRKYYLRDQLGMTVHPDHNGKMDGFFNVHFEKAGETTIERDKVAGLLLNWLQPIASTQGNTIAGMGPTTFPIVDDPKHGQIIRILLPEPAQNRQTMFILSKKFDWRILEISVDERGKKSIRTEFDYSLVNSQLELRSARSTSFHLISGQSLVSTILTVSHVRLSCKPEDLELVIPRPSFVMGLDDEKYLIKADGSKRNISDAEWRLATKFSQLAESDEGDLLKAKK